MRIKVDADILARNEEELGKAMGQIYKVARALIKAHEEVGPSPYDDTLKRPIWGVFDGRTGDHSKSEGDEA